MLPESEIIPSETEHKPFGNLPEKRDKSCLL